MKERRGDVYISKAPKTRPLRSSDAEEIVQGMIREGLKLANSESYDDEDAYVQGQVTERMIDWMRIGYRKAVRRFGDGNAYDISYLFDTITKTVNDRFTSGEFGDELHVQVDIRKMNVKIGVKSIY